MINKKRIVSVLLALGLCVSAVMQVSAETLDEVQQNVNDLQTQKDNVQSEADELSAQLVSLIEQMSSVEEQLTQKREEIKAAEENYVAAKVNENSQYQAMKKRIQYMYESGGTGVLEVMMSSSSMSDLLNKSEYASTVSSYDREMLEVYKDTLEEVKAQEDQIQQEYTDLENLQNQLIESQNEINTMLVEKNVEIESLSTQLGEQSVLLAQLIAQAEEEQRLQEEAAAAAAAAEEAAQAEAAYNSGYSLYLEGTSSVTYTGEAIFGNPCPGYSYISSTFGYRDYDASFHKGLDLAADAGTPTYAAAAGTVIIAGWSDSAGNWVVIDHGNGFVTKYMHHTAICVSAGEYVEAGQQIGYVGTTGNSSGNHLHFQVELDGEAVDPLLYTSL